MNLNPDEHDSLVEKIDQLVRNGQSTGIPAADDLAQTLPVANRAFQQSLEDRLVSQLQTQQVNEGEAPMTAVTSPTPDRKSWFYIPSTLVAALLALVLFGSILVGSNGQSPEPNAGVAAQTTVEPTAEPQVNVVVAQLDLLPSIQFPDTLEELSRGVGYAPWPASAVPPNALTEADHGLEQLLGRYLAVAVAREQPILSTYVVDDRSEAGPAAISAMGLIPERAAVYVPTSLVTWDMDSPIEPGDYVDVRATFLFTDVDENFQAAVPPTEGVTFDFSNLLSNQTCADSTPCPITQTVIRDSLLLHIGPLPDGKWLGAVNEPESDDVNTIVLSVAPDEAPLLLWLIEANIPLTLELAAPPSDYVPVVVAAQPLSWADQVMPGDVMVVYWPPERVPDGAVDDVSLAQGKYLNQRIEQWQPIVTDDLVDVSPYQPGTIPDGMTVTTVMQDWIANDISGLTAGENVDITVVFLNSPTEGGCEACNMLIPENGWMEIRPLLTDVKVFGFQYPLDWDTPRSLSIILPIEDVMLLNWLHMITHPIAITITPSDQNANPAQELPDGRVSLDVPRTSITNADEADGLINQGAVSVLADLYVRGFNPDDPTTYALEGGGNATVILAEIAEISAMDESTYRLTVPVEDLPMLQWALRAGLPIHIYHVP